MIFFFLFLITLNVKLKGIDGHFLTLHFHPFYLNSVSIGSSVLGQKGTFECSFIQVSLILLNFLGLSTWLLVEVLGGGFHLRL